MAKTDKVKEVRDAWAWIRKNNQSIPDDILDLMKDSAIEKIELENKLKTIEDDGMIPIPIPVGQFIIDNDTPHVSLPDGAYYHYSNVCRLLNIYKKECTEPYVNSLKNIMKINDRVIDKKELDKALDSCGKLAKKVLQENNQL
jgi:hypothetical protein